MAIQYNRPCEGRRLPGTSATTRDVGCQVLRKKRWNTCVFSMFFVGGFLRYNKLSHQIFIKKNIPQKLTAGTRKIGGLSRCSSLLLMVFFPGS